MYQQTTLENGIRVATEKLAGLDTVSIAISVDVGARYEEAKDSGISHFLEHMAFKGTARRDARAIAEQFDDIGGNLNAYTSLEHTVYHARVLKEDVAIAVDILADILQHSVFDEEEMAKERQVILQEIAMHKDAPDDLVFDYFQEMAYPDQPLGRPILGTPEHVEGFSPNDLRRFLGEHYDPKRIVVTAAGNIDHAQFLSLIIAAFNALPQTQAIATSAASYKGGSKIIPADFEQVHIVMGWKGLPVHHPDYYAKQLLSIILGGGMSSRLFQEIREKRGLAYHVQAFASGYADTGMFGVYTACSEQRTTELMPVLNEEIMNITRGVSEAELRRAKAQQKASIQMMRESSASVAEWIGRHLLVYGEYLTAARITEKIDRVSKEDIARVAESILSAGELSLAATGPTSTLVA